VLQVPDFRAWIRESISERNLPSHREEKIVGELASHFEDVYASLLDEGRSVDEAWEELIRRTPPIDELLKEILDDESKLLAQVRTIALIPSVVYQFFTTLAVRSKVVIDLPGKLRRVKYGDLLDLTTRNLRYALRRILRQPMFSLVAISEYSGRI
jgi:hypothetical protein